MSVYATFDETPGEQVASNKGWADFCGWIDSLPSERESLHHLREFGWVNGLPRLIEELERSKESNPPPDNDLENTIDEFLTFIDLNKEEKEVFITDGIEGRTPEERRFTPVPVMPTVPKS
jgi:hypothetical protein